MQESKQWLKFLVVVLFALILLEALYLWFYKETEKEGKVVFRSQAHGLHVKVDKSTYGKVYDDVIRLRGGVYHPANNSRFIPREINFTLTDKPQSYGRIIDPKTREVLKSFFVSYEHAPERVDVILHISRALLFDSSGRLKPNASKVIANSITEILFFLASGRPDFHISPEYQRFVQYTDKHQEYISSLIKLSTQ